MAGHWNNADGHPRVTRSIAGSVRAATAAVAPTKDQTADRSKRVPADAAKATIRRPPRAGVRPLRMKAAVQLAARGSR
jgi:hypothetical protein